MQCYAMLDKDFSISLESSLLCSPGHGFPSLGGVARSQDRGVSRVSTHFPTVEALRAHPGFAHQLRLL